MEIIGILNKAGQARDDSIVGQEKEQVELAYISATVKKLGDDVIESELQIELDSSVGNEKTDVSTNDDTTLNVYFTDTEHNYTVDNGNVTIAKKRIPIVTTPPTTAVLQKTKYKDTNNDIAVIPEGFRVSSDKNEQTIETGLVVKDSNDNEWVWIPVNDATDMYTTEGAPYTLRGETGITSSMASKSEIISGKTRTMPGITSDPVFREPDIIGSNSYDYNDYARAGFTNLADMAQNLVTDYEEMIASIEKYKGFYVGRYELTGSEINPTEQANKTPLVSTLWYNLYKACKTFSVSDVVESRMIWGCQWDMTCNFIAKDSTYSITNSSNWGNYNNTEVLSSDGTSIIKSSGTSTKLNTGVTTFTMAKNIYDIAGNCYEWTQEAYDYRRAYRGGVYSGNGASYSASYRGYYKPNSSQSYLSSRPTLYIK